MKEMYVGPFSEKEIRENVVTNEEEVVKTTRKGRGVRYL